MPGFNDPEVGQTGSLSACQVCGVELMAAKAEEVSCEAGTATGEL